MRAISSHPTKTAIRLVVISCAIIALHLSAYGQTNTWINSAPGKWEDASSWSLGTAPGIGDAADLITNAGGTTVTNDATTAGSFPGTMVISNLTVTAPTGSTNTLVLSNIGTNLPLVVHNSVIIGPGGVLQMTNSLLSLDGATDGVFSLDSTAILYDSILLLNTNVAVTVGTVGSGTLLAAGGTNTLSGDVYVGYSTNSIGSVLLTAGQLVMSNGNMAVGFYGSGRVAMSNGMLMFGSISNNIAPPTGALLGATASSSGQLNISGGTCLENGHFGLGEEFGSTGLVWVSNGQLIVTNGYLISIGGNGVGQMVVSNGQMSAYDVGVANGPASQGTLTIAGGTGSFSGGLIVGIGLGATGSVSVTSGQLTVNNQTIMVGSYGVGQMTVSNSSLLARAIRVGNSSSSCGTLTFAGSTTATVSNIVAGAYSNSTGVILLTGGSLGVTNQSGTALLAVGLQGKGILTQNGGSLTVDQLFGINGTNSQFNFNAGSLGSKSTTVSNTQTFVVGDGVNAATFRLLGGIHTFSNGLRVRSNAMLIGCGTINGNVLVDAGGSMISDCGGTLLVTGTVTNNGVMEAVNGGTLESYGLVVNNGLINVLSGNTNFHAGFVNNGFVLNSNSIPQIESINVVGQDVHIRFSTSIGATYIIEDTTNLVSGNWIPLIGFTSAGGDINLFDPGAASLPQNFYRVRLVVPQ